MRPFSPDRPEASCPERPWTGSLPVPTHSLANRPLIHDGPPRDDRKLGRARLFRRAAARMQSTVRLACEQRPNKVRWSADSVAGEAIYSGECPCGAT